MDPDTIRALTGNFYVAVPTDKSLCDPVAEKHGLSPEKNSTPFDWANVEPVHATGRIETETCARERGVGEISVRGMGIRVMVAVVTSNGPVDNDPMAYSSGGDPKTSRSGNEVDSAPTIGFVEHVPIGETDHNQKWRPKTRRPMITLQSPKVCTLP